MSEKPTGQEASAILLSVTQSIAVFSALLPPFAEVRKGNKNDPAMREDVRMGELAASSLVIAIGLIASGVTGTPAPAVVSVVAAVVLVGMYETVLAK
jgi:hypothetical protein